MFRKVFKYDFLAVIKLWSMFAGICLTGGVMAGIGANLSASGIGSFMVITSLSLLGTLSLYSLPVATVVLLVKNYVGTMFSRRGYLTFMLPVKRSTIYWSKVASAAVYQVMTAVVLYVSAAIAALINVDGYSSVVPEITDIADELARTSNFFENFIYSNILILAEFGFVVGIFELVTGFRLAVAPGGGKRIALTIILIVVTFDVLFVMLIVTAVGGILSAAFSGSSAEIVPEWMRTFSNVTGQLSVLFAVATFDAVCVMRSLYLIEHRLNLR